ncbi:SART-1 family protein DOT2 [Gracilariopsis chorda]|uniref:SART-1 family protein DOT2 n=1 Tax=Gracilariopsis chorda TaxID=448386 RepID=A0A2V3J6Y3_9FLOR|nr:SART-1 family protein DOT2 [Gracilariopsis chorda]|eukprot:PXF50134.1 SART-1 family protein DOT2 [Gracilariopsis chorda]
MTSLPRPKPSKNSAGELTFSTEDTNRLRLALGLRPLRPTSASPSKPAHAKTITKNGEITCSVEETNRLRASLGLRPLRTEQTPHTSEPAASHSVSTGDSNALQRRLQQARAARAVRNVIAPLSIAEAVRDEEKQRELHSNQPSLQTKKRKRQTSGSVELPERVEDELAPGEQMILTLRDKPVLEVKEGPDVLQHPAQERTEDISSQVDGAQRDINGMEYDGTDTAQFRQQQQPTDLKDAIKLSIERKDIIIEDDFDKKPTFSKRPRKREKKRRKRVAEEEPVSKGHLKALREKAEQKLKEHSDTDDEYYERMATARRKQNRADKERAAQRILHEINRFQSDNDDQNNAAVVYTAMDQFLVDVPAQTHADDIDPSPQKDQAGKSGKKPSDLNHGDEHKPDEVESTEDKDAPISKRSEETKISAVESAVPTAEEIKQPSETNGMTGLAATLKRLRQTGVLNRRPTQMGRARDQWYDDSDDDSANDGKPRVKLAYVDEYGNKLTPKEAYRLLSHRFHGNAPRQNKREKRLQKILEAKDQS